MLGSDGEVGLGGESAAGDSAGAPPSVLGPIHKINHKINHTKLW